MNRIAQSIRNRLSLRKPQEYSLNILAEMADRLMLKKHTPNPSQEEMSGNEDQVLKNKSKEKLKI